MQILYIHVLPFLSHFMEMNLELLNKWKVKTSASLPTWVLPALRPLGPRVSPSNLSTSAALAKRSRPTTVASGGTP